MSKTKVKIIVKLNIIYLKMTIEGQVLLDIEGTLFLFNDGKVVGYLKNFKIYPLRICHLEFLKSKNIEVNPDVIEWIYTKYDLYPEKYFLD